MRAVTTSVSLKNSTDLKQRGVLVPIIGVTGSSKKDTRRYREALEKRGAQTRLLLPGTSATYLELLHGIEGLLLTGGEDVDPMLYSDKLDASANLELPPSRDALELSLLKEAMDRDLPILAICRGMQLLNVATGGRLIQDLPGHRAERREGQWRPSRHAIYVSPGSKLAAIMGTGGFFRVNSLHHQGIREPQKSPLLLASAYALEDGNIEGMESPHHTWVIGVQFQLEREEEVPPPFLNLFHGLIEWADQASR